MAAGALTVGIAGRRPLLLVAGVGALVALPAPGDPWHDLGLLVFCADWAADGALRVRKPGRRRDLTGETSRSARERAPCRP